MISQAFRKILPTGVEPNLVRMMATGLFRAKQFVPGRAEVNFAAGAGRRLPFPEELDLACLDQAFLKR
jgi:hypothetical protein